MIYDKICKLKRWYLMKKAINLRLDEGMILILNQLSQELNTTKTEIIENAIKLFFKTKQKEQNELLQFAGILKENEANKMLNTIKENKNSKDFKIDL